MIAIASTSIIRSGRNNLLTWTNVLEELYIIGRPLRMCAQGHSPEN
jgi:hypothetical protein